MIVLAVFHLNYIMGAEFVVLIPCKNIFSSLKIKLYIFLYLALYDILTLTVI